MEVELIILGGGCAGLSLALELARRNDHCPSTLILEKRKVYSADRTWGYWRESEDIYSKLVSKRFSKMRVNYGKTSQLLHCERTPYSIIPSNRFYAFAEDQINLHPKLDLVLGSVISTDPVKVDGRWEIRTQNCVYYSRNVVDTRPSLSPLPSGQGLWQSFYGMEIECNEKSFNPECVDLMDFQDNERFPIFFTYVVPTSSTRALIEVTVFDPRPIEKEELASALQIAIQKRIGLSTFIKVREEAGILPMGILSDIDQQDATYVKAGLFAGAARPSTGYAFQRIQTWASRCAAELIKGRHPVPHAPDPWMMRTMDKVFISVLRAHPEISGSLFLTLFQKVSTSRLIRFLCGRPTLLDCAAVIFSLPARIFLTELPVIFRSNGG